MKFYRLDEAPKSNDDQVFKESPTINAIAALVVFGLAITLAVFGVLGRLPEGMSPGVSYVIAAIIGLFGLIPLFNFRASLKPTNWLMRCNLSGIVLNLRGYENWRLPTDREEAVGIEHGEIAWAKLVKETRTSPSMNSKSGSEITFVTYIDLGLANPDTSKLEATIDAVRNRRPNGIMITLDYPVQTRPGGIVEIRWSPAIRPSAHDALKVLGQRIRIIETEHRKTDLTYRGAADRQQEDAKILALAKSGDEMAATDLAQRVYGCSLSDATERVNQMLGRKDDD